MTEKSIGQRIKETLTDKDISQKELAEKIGVDETGLSRIVHGKQDITGEQLAAVAKELNVRSDYLLGMDSDIDEETHFLHELMNRMRRITTTEEYLDISDKVYSPDDLIFSISGDYIVVKGPEKLFQLIREFAKIEKKKIPPKEIQDRIDNIARRYGKMKSGSRTETYYFVTGRQMEELGKKFAMTEIGVKQALKEIGTEPHDGE